MASSLGFHSLEDEQTASLAVEGSLPDWLTGSLIRNGPGSFALSEEGSVDHWFDGLAMCYRFTFDPGNHASASIGGAGDAVHYRNRFLETDAYRAAQAGAFTGGFATGETTLRERLKGLFTEPYDNTNIIVERVGGRYLALTESPRATELDPNTLGVKGDIQYDGSDPAGQLVCAHLKRDPATGTLFNIETEFGRTSTYHVHAISDDGSRQHLGSVETDAPAYMHSFALTPRYVILTEFPLRVNPLTFFKPGRQGPFIEQFEWQPDRGTRVIVIDRASGAVIAEPTTDAVFGFHHVNAFERNDGTEVVFDLETIPDATAISELSLDSLREGNLDAVAGRLERFTVDLGSVTGTARYETDDATVTREMLYDDGTALPTVSPARWCRAHRYVYAMSMDQPATEWATGILKYDTETGDVIEFEDGGDYFGEPIFVPRADGPEDAGVVLTVALDVEADHSRLIVFVASLYRSADTGGVVHAMRRPNQCRGHENNRSNHYQTSIVRLAACSKGGIGSLRFLVMSNRSKVCGRSRQRVESSELDLELSVSGHQKSIKTCCRSVGRRFRCRSRIRMTRTRSKTLSRLPAMMCSRNVPSYRRDKLSPQVM